jgi:hypothetical protein
MQKKKEESNQRGIHSYVSTYMHQYQVNQSVIGVVLVAYKLISSFISVLHTGDT